MSSANNTIKDIVSTARRLYERGMLAGTDGNISVRVGSDEIWITPAGLAKGGLKFDDLVKIDSEGHHLSGKLQASTELAMHLAVYKGRPEIAACVHSHAPHATACAVTGVKLADDILPEVVVFVGKIATTEYAPPGTEAVPRSLEPFLADHNAFLLRNHGLLTIGRTLTEAYHRHEVVEHYAKIMSIAGGLGSIEPLPSDEIVRLKTLRN